jgi:hypothetical protein
MSNKQANADTLSSDFFSIEKLVADYNLSIQSFDVEARNSARSYGGWLRSKKGKLVEKLTERMIRIAWHELGEDPIRMSFEKRMFKYRMHTAYLDRTEDYMRETILKNIDKYYYGVKSDVHCQIDGKIVIAVECKAYAENAMLKRILVDFDLLSNFVDDTAQFYLLQLESQLGGDYSKVDFNSACGSGPTITLMSHFRTSIKIITMLDGERKIDEPIHKKEFFKEMKVQRVRAVVDEFKSVLSLQLTK